MDKSDVFISYSRGDDAWLKQLKPHLKQLTIQYEFKFWVDTDIKPGKEWKKEIDRSIANCEVALLMVSVNFLASEFINNEEVPGILRSAKRKGVKIFILVLDICIFDEHSPLYKYQCLNDPEKPLELLDDTSKRQTFVNVAKEIRSVLIKNREELTNEKGNLQIGDYFHSMLVLAALVESASSSMPISDLMQLMNLKRSVVVKLLYLLEEKELILKEKIKGEGKKRPSTWWRVSDLGLNIYNEFKSSFNTIIDRSR